MRAQQPYKGKVTLLTELYDTVPGVQELLEKRDPELASDELIFPTDDSLRGATDLRPLTPEEEREVEAAYQAAIGA